MSTPRLGAPELVTSQANKEELVNEQIRYLEAAGNHFVIVDRDLSAPPGSPVDGTTYIVAGTGTGAWAGHDGDIAHYLNTAWVFINIIEGFTFWINDENKFLVATTSSTFQEFATTATVTVTECIILAPSDETTALTTGTAKITFRMPYAFTLTDVRASVTTAPTGATIIVDVNEGGSTVLSTKVTIDATEKTSQTGAVAEVISDTTLADDAEITIDIDQVGSTIAGAGLKVVLIGHQ